MRIELLCTGDEILTGKTVNSNYTHIVRRLIEVGLEPYWGTTVGDDRASLLAAFRQAAARAQAVIVNGGLGPTVDDLSQEVAAQAAGVALELHEPWLARMEEFYRRRNRVMPPNNRKQAMLPVGAEFIDNPVGTACGFAVTIDGARFFFTPGVPREMRRMIDDQVIPRLLALGGVQGVTRVKRFHSFGIGESRADQMLDGLEAMAPGVKLGFQAHFPQLETKLAVRGADAADVERMLAPAEAEVRARLGNFIMAEDDETLEGVVLRLLRARDGTLSVAETFTGGTIATRLAPSADGEGVFRRGVVARDLAQLCDGVGLEPDTEDGGTSPAAAAAVATALRATSGASHALAVLITVDPGADGIELGGTISIGIADGGLPVSREARLFGGRDWIRLGATEMALDCLRRHMLGLPVDEQIDFERR